MSAQQKKNVASVRRGQGLAEGVISRLQRAWGESPFYQSQLKGPAPDRLSFQPDDVYTPDKKIAEMLDAGRLVFWRGNNRLRR